MAVKDRYTKERNKKISESRKGMKFTEEHKRNLSKAKIKSGTKPPSRKGCIPWNYSGRAKTLLAVRDSKKYFKWMSDIFERDNWTCQTCGKRGCYLSAHHIKAFSLIAKNNKLKDLEDALKCSELWDINNGVTLCKDCHKLTDNYMGRARWNLAKIK